MMLNNIKILSLLVVVLVFTQNLFAQSVTLEFWDNQQTESGLSELQSRAVKRFESENPDIKINVTTIPYPEYQQRLLTAFNSGNAPDIATLDQIWVALFAEANAIADLTEDAKSSRISRDNFFGGAWDSANYKNKLYGIPFNVDVWQFSFYNKKLLREAKVNPSDLQTFSGLLKAAKKLTKKNKGKYGVGIFGHKGEDTVVVMDSFIFSRGGNVINSDGTCGLTSKESLDALNYLKDLSAYAPKGILNASSGSMRELFLNESLAIEFWPALEQPTLQKSKIDWDFVAGTGYKKNKPIGTFGGWNLAIFSQSKNKKAAWKFIEFMVRDDVNGEVVDLIPANKNAASEFLKKNRSRPDVIMDHLNNAKPRPLNPKYLQIADVQLKLAQNIFSGKDVKKSAISACKEIDSLR